MMEPNKKRRMGFTLIEVLLVIAILLVLGTVSVVAYTRIKEGADKKATKLLVDQTVDAVNLYHLAVNRYPEDDQGLQALLTAPDDEALAEKWRDGGGPFLDTGKIPLDPWGTELKYARRDATEVGPAFRVFSCGPDGTEGTDDDISSYTETSG